MPTYTLPLIIEPDPEDPQCATVLVDGEVNGETARFLLDTGAARTQVVHSEHLELETGQTETSGGVFAPTVHRLAGLDRLDLGGLQIDGLTVAVPDPGAAVLNLLGMDVLGRFRCSFRFGERDLILDDGPGSEMVEGQELIIGSRGHAYVQVEIGGQNTHACWDSGAGITLVNQSFAAAHPDLFSEETVSTGSDVTGATIEAATFTMTGPTIAGRRFDDHRVAVIDLARVARPEDPPVELILGYPTLCQVDWTMDFPARGWWLTAPDGPRPQHLDSPST